MAISARPLLRQAQNLKTSVHTVYRFRRELLAHRRTLLMALLCSIGYTLMRLAEPWPLKFIFDSVLMGLPLSTPFPWLNQSLSGKRVATLALSAGAILMLALLRGEFYYHQRFLTSKAGQEVVLNVRRQLFAHIQRLSLGFHARSSTGDLLTRLTGDINMLRELVVASLLSLVTETVVLAGYVAIIFWMNWRLALLALITIPVIFVLVTLYKSRIREAARKQRRREGEVASRLHETLSGIHIVQLFAREDEEDERLRDLNRRSLRSGLKTTRLEAQLNRSVEIAIATAMAATLWFGAMEVLAGRLTSGELIVFVSYMQRFYRPLRRISRVTERAGKAGSCVERITEVLDETPDVRDGTEVAPRFTGEVCFQGVGFSYRRDTPALRDLHLVAAAGQTIALVGPSGAGKSTLLGMIPRLNDPDTGSVRIDGRDVRKFTLKSLREQISIVPQDGMLFGGSIRENIAYGKPEATDEEIQAAARMAQIHDYISSLPDGYETDTGERGGTLSGGQRQRLAIARAIVKDAPIVLLDEPTTGLDSESEALVLAALDKLLEDRTAIVIAHRLSTMRRADVILVMEDGRIVEQGTHEELLAKAGRYADLYSLQFLYQEREEQVGVAR